MKLTKKLISCASALALAASMFTSLVAFAETDVITLEKNAASAGTTLIIDAKSNVTSSMMSLTVQLDLAPIKNNIDSCTVTRGSVLTGSGMGNYIKNTGKAIFNDANAMGGAISVGDVLGTFTITLKEAITSDTVVSLSNLIMQLDSDGDMSVDTKYNLAGNAGWTKVNTPSITLTAEKKDPTIALDPTSATLKMGETETVTIKATTENFDGTVEWKSDNEKVATVDKGVVTAVGAGEATITATAGTATATCKITVEPADVPAPVITVKPDTAEMILGNTVELVASNDQDAKLTYTYKSSNDKIATVDVNGVVKAVGEGSAIITVSAEGATSAECTINVKKATVGEDFTSTELGKKIKFIGMELLGVDSSDKYVYITKDGKETRKYDKTIGEILGGVWGAGASVEGSIAIGIITADESSVFSFEIK